MFLEALSLLADETRKKAKFLIIGSHNPKHNYYQEVVNKAALFDEVTIIPSIPQEEVMRHYQKAHVVVSTSLTDPMPLVVTQGLMLGMPCLVSDAIGQADLLKDEGVLDVYPAGDAKALAERLAYYINNADKGALENPRARSVYKKYFSVESFEKRLAERIDELLAQRRSQAPQINAM